jgi:hypothetical protein
MPSTSRVVALALAIQLAPALAAGLAAQGGPGGAAGGNPACTLLTPAEVEAATGRDYDQASPGDAMGEGAGGGASCQWGGASFIPGKEQPLLSVVFIPAQPRGSYTEFSLEQKPMKGCTRETLRGIGDLGFIETCERSRGPVAYIKAGPNDLIVQADPEEGKPAASARPVVVALAKSAVARAGGLTK